MVTARSAGMANWDLCEIVKLDSKVTIPPVAIIPSITNHRRKLASADRLVQCPQCNNREHVYHPAEDTDLVYMTL